MTANGIENLQLHLHHIHLFTEDCDATVAWWQRAMGAKVAFDGIMGGSRNVFLRVGEGRLHLYDQRPRDTGKGATHHIGIRVHDLHTLNRHLQSIGVAFRSDVREFGNWRYVMCPAPDGVLLELFEIDTESMESALAAYFSDSSDS
jgi:catechol 2,3-dioxygenase-like lactoylglutathione lyase family enzyme